MYFKCGKPRYGYELTYHWKAQDKRQKELHRKLEFLIYYIITEFRGHIFQQIAGIPMGTNCATLFAEPFIY